MLFVKLQDKSYESKDKFSIESLFSSGGRVLITRRRPVVGCSRAAMRWLVGDVVEQRRVRVVTGWHT